MTHTKTFRYFASITLGLVFLMSARQALTNIRVTPVAFYLDDKNRSGSFFVENASEKTQEVLIDIRFGYPISDSKGGVLVAYGDTMPFAEHSMAKWINIYPRKFSLEPGQPQTVRFVLQPPAGLPDNEYWARAIIVAVAAEDTSGVGGDNVSVRLGFRYQTGVAISFRHGAVRTAVVIDTVLMHSRNDSLDVYVAVTRNGNAAFLGTIEILIRDSKGGLFMELRRDIAVYGSLRRVYSFVLPPAVIGKKMTADVILKTDRRSNLTQGILPSPSISKSGSVAGLE